MAEGGRFTEDDIELMMDDISHGDDDDANTTQPFQPDAASTPYHGGEQYEMQRMQDEQSGLPSYDETTPLISNEEIQRRLSALREDPITGLLDTTKADTSVNPLSEEDKAKQIPKVKNFIKARYPNTKFDDLVIKFSSKKTMDIVVLGKRGRETKIVLDDGSGLQKSFLNMTFVKKALGESFEELQRKENEEVYRERQRLIQTGKQKNGR